MILKRYGGRHNETDGLLGGVVWRTLSADRQRLYGQTTARGSGRNRHPDSRQSEFPTLSRVIIFTFFTRKWGRGEDPDSLCHLANHNCVNPATATSCAA